MFFTLLPLIQLYKHLLWRSKLGTKRVCFYSGATLTMVAVHVPLAFRLGPHVNRSEQPHGLCEWLVIWRLGMIKANSEDGYGCP